MARKQPTDQPSLFQYLDNLESQETISKVGQHGHPNPMFVGHYRKGCRFQECVTVWLAYHKRRHVERMATEPSYREAVAKRSRRWMQKERRDPEKRKTEIC